jgi:5-hydroxyisourate hydrolase
MISTHVLDTARGRPAAGVLVVLEAADRDGESMVRREIGRATTDADGRIRELLPPPTALGAGDYCLTFETAPYFAASGAESFYPRVTVFFTVRDASQHHHVPLLLSPYGYSTYRGT